MLAFASISVLRLLGATAFLILNSRRYRPILYLALVATWRHSFFKGSEPAAFRRRLGLEGFNFCGLLQRQADVVEPV